MEIFKPTSQETQTQNAELYALYELAYTLVDFLAATLFIIGSLLFFDEATTTLGTWMFLIGSICFGLKPTIRLVREIHLWRLGNYKQLAERTEE